jgi:hypothetical protein
MRVIDFLRFWSIWSGTRHIVNTVFCISWDFILRTFRLNPGLLVRDLSEMSLFIRVRNFCPFCERFRDGLSKRLGGTDCGGWARSKVRGEMIGVERGRFRWGEIVCSRRLIGGVGG